MPTYRLLLANGVLVGLSRTKSKHQLLVPFLLFLFPRISLPLVLAFLVIHSLPLALALPNGLLKIPLVALNVRFVANLDTLLLFATIDIILFIRLLWLLQLPLKLTLINSSLQLITQPPTPLSQLKLHPLLLCHTLMRHGLWIRGLHIT